MNRRILDPDFSYREFGLEARLITEDDAAFIVELRADPSLTKYMVTLDPDIEKQKEWIREYKKRERQGKDCFIIYRDENGNRRGINRISEIDFESGSCKASGWIKKKGSREEAIAMFVIHKKIMFDFLGLTSFYSDVHKDNFRALKYYVDLPQAKEERNGYLYFRVSKEEMKRAYLPYFEN